MLDRFTRERQKTGQQLSKKGGRPKKVSNQGGVGKGPGRKGKKSTCSKLGQGKTELGHDDNIVFISSVISLLFSSAVLEDQVSYEANVKKMMELHKKSGDPAGIRHLWKVTHEIRTKKVEDGEIAGIEDLLKHCPVLNQPAYVRIILLMTQIT